MKKIKEKRFWYDARDVSGSHAEVTVGIAGLALALLLVLPIFGDLQEQESCLEQEQCQEEELVDNNYDNSSADRHQEKEQYYETPNFAVSLLFFFSSLLYGVLASFGYSVLSGDQRSERALLYGFLAPSVAFGVSVPTLFLGFVFIIYNFLGEYTEFIFVQNLLRWFMALSLWASAILVTRTIVETILFTQPDIKQEKKLKKAWSFIKKNLVRIFSAIYTALLFYNMLKRPISSIWDTMDIDGYRRIVEPYFYYLVGLGFFSVFYYAVTSYSEREPSSNIGKGNTGDYRVVFAWLFWFAFIGFISWTHIMFL